MIFLYTRYIYTAGDRLKSSLDSHSTPLRTLHISAISNEPLTSRSPDQALDKLLTAIVL